MGLSIKPIECPGGCLGCYEKGIRDRGAAPAFEVEKVLKALAEQMDLDKENKWNTPTLHGGEPLALPIASIEAILRTVFEKYGKSGVQTSGALLLPEHVELFKKYKTNVGISIDGDTPTTNAGRWNSPGFDSAAGTRRTLAALAQLKEAGIALSIITILRKCNAGTPALRDDLLRFALRIRNDFGVSSIRFNPLIAFDDRTAREEELGIQDLAATFKKLIIRTIADNSLQFYPMLDFIRGLRGEEMECTFGECDPWATEAEIPILGDGSLGVCLKGGGGPDGLATLRIEKTAARYEALTQVAQEAGGCRGCFWWPYCKGGCPGAGIDGDWRNRSRFCEAYKMTFEFISRLPLFSGARSCTPAPSGSHGDREHGDSNDPAWRAKNTWWKGTVKCN